MTLKKSTRSKLYLTLLCEYFIFLTPTTPTFDVALEVCVCVCVCVCDYFFHFVSCSVFLIDLVTSVLLP